VFAGDLTLDKFGLDESTYRYLAQQVDCVIHAAANVGQSGRYEDFYSANVESTRHLLDFCFKGTRKDFNFISTISVASGVIKGKKNFIFTEYHSDEGQEISNNYVRSKLEAEKLVSNAREKGIRANVFRVGYLVFDSKTGAFQENVEKSFYFNIIKDYIHLGAVPETGSVINFSFVDKVSDAILLLFDRKNLENETFHIVNSCRIEISALLFEKFPYLSVKKMPVDEFIDFLGVCYRQPHLKSYAENLMQISNWMHDLEYLKDLTHFTVLSDKTNNLLKKMWFDWPGPDREKFNKLISLALSGRIKSMKKLLAFSGLPQDLLEILAGAADEEYYEEDSEIYAESRADKRIQLVLEGEVELCRRSLSGWSIVVERCTFGDFLGGEDLFSDEPSDLSAVVTSKKVRLLSYPREGIRKIINEKPEIGVMLLKEISKKLNRMEKALAEIE